MKLKKILTERWLTWTFLDPKLYEDTNHKGKYHDLPAIFRRWISKSKALATGSFQGNVLDMLVNFIVLLGFSMVLQQACLRGRCHTRFNSFNKTRKGTVDRTSCSKVCTMLKNYGGQWSIKDRMVAQRVLVRYFVYLIGGWESREDEIDERKL